MSNSQPKSPTILGTTEDKAMIDLMSSILYTAYHQHHFCQECDTTKWPVLSMQRATMPQPQRSSVRLWQRPLLPTGHHQLLLMLRLTPALVGSHRSASCTQVECQVNFVSFNDICALLSPCTGVFMANKI